MLFVIVQLLLLVMVWLVERTLLVLRGLALVRLEANLEHAVAEGVSI